MKEEFQIHVAIFVLAALVVMTLFMIQDAQGLQPGSFQCADCENRAKTEHSQSDDADELYLEEGQIITEVQVKAGQGCFIPDGTCYAIAEGGVGFSYVVVTRLSSGPNCQAISHIEVCYEEAEATPTYTDTPVQEESPTPTSTNTPENTPTPTSTYTPTVENTETPTPTDDPDTPTPTNTPTFTQTPDPGVTPSDTPCPTPSDISPTPSDTPRPTFTPGPSPTSSGNGLG